MTRTDSQGRRLCSATAKSTGNPCRSPAVNGATVCIRHGAAKGTPAREKADRIVLSELIGPALSRLKGLIESQTTPGPTLMAAIREVLERTRYEDPHLMTLEELQPHIQRHIAMLKAEQATAEARIPKELPASPRVQHFGFYNDDGEFVWEDRPIKPRR